ncbi:helix-turn-helix domain-containing protein [Xanthobacter sp. KR7-225]|uniref:helix-turn-helix domain-containing protein n=1 Tax=Xanthobacter sp. KR7-225 TaxID=3156613 RepID=UPI0032B552BF
MDHSTLTGRQIAAARALVGLSQADVATRANISVPTLKRMEASEGPAAGLANNVAAVMRTLEAAGIAFLAEGQAADGGPGVRLAKPD